MLVEDSYIKNHNFETPKAQVEQTNKILKVKFKKLQVQISLDYAFSWYSSFVINEYY